VLFRLHVDIFDGFVSWGHLLLSLGRDFLMLTHILEQQRACHHLTIPLKVRMGRMSTYCQHPITLE
jgi:hypothetical protein